MKGKCRNQKGQRYKLLRDQVIYSFILGFLPLISLYLIYKVGTFFGHDIKDKTIATMKAFIPNEYVFVYYLLIIILAVVFGKLSGKKRDIEIKKSMYGKMVAIVQFVAGNFLASAIIISIDGRSIRHMWIAIYYVIFLGIAWKIEEYLQEQKYKI
ncbi:MAG: hypothetical protein A2077_01230 [Nitrospirae bacterium GWC2_46_6]|nr:MAG: hypothetical protein A2077_01230 [Nitrospirae bacterium GWC2_46_6]OGW21136.1 MAG: hypothetical protein A2Z82_00790 [Nitrospirae bacterium GWA2_46_11]OGW23819.1 MAG: hypothetical protein A2X55_11945 [Nitrospirae bacterium GWB2_47_37]HAK88481.1 hypothetical protein [Nitrospiraceae bacterium]